jgi:hypothetical protein
LQEYLENDVVKQLQQGAVPIVACQEHGQRGPWLCEATAALANKGWHVVAAPAQATEAGGTSAGVLLAFPACVGVCKAHSQQAWDISPVGAAGRLVLALFEVKAIGKLAVFSAYLWTDKSLRFAGNVAILDAITQLTQQLGLPWVVAGDWQNLPQELEHSPWHKEVAASILAWHGPGGTCRSGAQERVIDFFWVGKKLAGMLEGPFMDENTPHAPHRPTWIKARNCWAAYRVRVPCTPKQFPLERPYGCIIPPPQYPSRREFSGQPARP